MIAKYKIICDKFDCPLKPLYLPYVTALCHPNITVANHVIVKCVAFDGFLLVTFTLLYKCICDHSNVYACVSPGFGSSGLFGQTSTATGTTGLFGQTQTSTGMF